MIIDHRTYTVAHGKMQDYLMRYERDALPIQLRHLGGLVGFWVSEVGPLNQVVHIWRYASMADREERRARMAQDPVAHGRFTRAYLEAVFTDQALGDDNPSAALSVSTIADPELLGEWSTWLAQRLEQHAATDDNALCEVVRLAADGVWLISISPDPTSPINFARARAAMLALTMLGA